MDHTVWSYLLLRAVTGSQTYGRLVTGGQIVSKLLPNWLPNSSFSSSLYPALLGFNLDLSFSTGFYLAQPGSTLLCPAPPGSTRFHLVSFWLHPVLPCSARSYSAPPWLRCFFTHPDWYDYSVTKRSSILYPSFVYFN